MRKADLVLKPGMPVYLTLEDVSVTLKPTKLANVSQTLFCFVNQSLLGVCDSLRQGGYD